MVHIVESLAVEATNDVHYVAEYYSSMESSRLRWFPRMLNFGPFSQVYVELVNVVKSLLIRVHASKDENVASAHHS